MFKMFCYFYLKLTGWKFINVLPKEVKTFVMIGAPHTSNWDFLPAMAFCYKSKIPPKFVIKNEWLKVPVLGLLLKWLGAVGIDRAGIQKGEVKSSTDLIAALFKENQSLVLMIAPEGSRSRKDSWKTGFYYIALKAKVPIALGRINSLDKSYGIVKLLYPSGDFDKDMEEISSHYRGVEGKNHGKFSLDKRFL